MHSLFHVSFECTFCLLIHSTNHCKIIFYKQFVRQNRAQNVIYDVVDNVTVLLVLDFNKRVKIVKSMDVMSLKTH